MLHSFGLPELLEINLHIMIICESYGAFLVRFCELISSDCIVWVEVEILDPVAGVCVTVGPFSWVRSALPTSPYPLSPISLSPLYALIIPRPIYSHLLWLTVGMNRATNSTGSLNEGRSNLKVRTMGLLLESCWFKISDQGNRTMRNSFLAALIWWLLCYSVTWWDALSRKGISSFVFKCDLPQIFFRTITYTPYTKSYFKKKLFSFASLKCPCSARWG